MKFDKEYPATHSMETAWYAADEDGNVALVNYNSNGPVPKDLHDVDLGELAFGYEYDKDCRYVQITEEQMEEMSDPTLPIGDEDSLYVSDIYVKVEKENREAFETAMNKARLGCRLINDNWGLYAVDNDVMERSGLAKGLNKKKLISKVYKVPYFDVDGDELKDGKPVFTKNFKSCSYYVYAEPYWPDTPMERINIPKNPVKIVQFPKKLRQRIPVIPIKFKDSKTFQIAEWIMCKTELSDHGYLNGCCYDLLPLSDGTMAYLLDTIDAVSFLPYCSEKEKYNCKECPRYRPCAMVEAQVFTFDPTVMMIVSPQRSDNFNKNKYTDTLIQHSIILPYLPKIPIPSDDYFINIDKVRWKISQHEMDEFFVASHKYLDDMVKRYRPRVIIIGRDVDKVMHDVYKMTNTEITFGNESYPYFKESDVEAYRQEIESLAKLPYRGQLFTKIISVEEMEKLGEIK